MSKAHEILELLAQKHIQDVFVKECPAGHTGQRMDGWAMRKSWAKPLMVGYEIKVSRQDFLGDQKWMGYLPFCNQLYFVCEQGVASVAEVPEQCGLMLRSKNGSRLFTKKKAPHRQTVSEDIEQLQKAVLMNRIKIVESTFGQNTETCSGLEYWENWLARKKRGEDIGREVRFALSEESKKMVQQVKSENRRLSMQNEAYANIKKICDDLGITASRYTTEEQIVRAMKNTLTGGMSDACNGVKNVKFGLEGLLSDMERLLSNITADDEHGDKKGTR